MERTLHDAMPPFSVCCRRYVQGVWVGLDHDAAMWAATALGGKPLR